MKDPVRLGRIGGIPVGLNWSLMAIVVFLAVGLAQHELPAEAPGYATASYVAVGTVTAIALLVAVLLHELGHAVLARAAKLQVEGVTLSWMGGVTHIEDDFRRPAVELWVALIGPLVSLAAGGAFWIARVVLTAAGAGRLAVVAVTWLAVINIVLAVFNLLPASPLDGGRVLHALIWLGTKDRWTATRVATFAGTSLGVALVAAGLWFSTARKDLLDGVLTGVMGWWLITAAHEETQVAQVHRVLDGVPLGDLMRPVAAAPGWITVRTFADNYLASRQSHVWLLEKWGGDGFDGILIGPSILSVPMPQWDLVRPRDVALPVESATGAGPYDDAFKALARSGGHKVILVIEGGHTIGAVLPSDVEALVRSGRRPPSRTAPIPA